jgi:lipoate-protein ligase A
MRWIDPGQSRDPAFHLAVEEWCVRNLDPEPGYLLLYVNDPCVVVGKNQVVHLEVALPWIRSHRVPVVRRISGGGTVYHDPGNLNFTFFRPFRPGDRLDYAAYLDPVARALNAMGLPVERNERNDLVLDGRKVSGNAQFTTTHAMFSHGTLLFDADLDAVRGSLAADATGIETRAVRSVRSPVANLRPHLPEPMDLETFRVRLARLLLEDDRPDVVRLDDDALDAIRRLADDRFRTWNWTYGRAPRFTVRRSLDLGDDRAELVFEVRDGRIDTVRIPAGDDRRRLAHVAAHLTGVRYDREALHEALADADAHGALDGADPAGLAARLHD